MNRDQMRKRTQDFALRVIRLVAALPKNRASDVLGRQLLKAGTSVGANYREALRASSKRHFVSTIQIVLREADETLYWLELLAKSGTMKPARLAALTQECQELVAIFTATVQTARRNSNA
jgi:four helix bundle protein